MHHMEKEVGKKRKMIPSLMNYITPDISHDYATLARDFISFFSLLLVVFALSLERIRCISV